MKQNNRRIVVQLRGGLGNQLFGLFAGLFVAEKYGGSVILDGRLINFGSNPSRKIEVDKLDMRCISQEVEIKKDIWVFRGRLSRKLLRPYQDCIVRYLKKGSPELVVGDETNLFSLENHEDIYLDGYFANHLFFKEWFKLNSDFVIQPKGISRDLLSYMESLKGMDGIHIRLGDYLNHPDIYPIPSENYYLEGLRRIENDGRYVLFCENVEETRTRFPSLVNGARFIITSKEFEPLESLFLMTCCKNLVIANSTFSQWAGVFVDSKGGHVVYPRQFLYGSESRLNYSFGIEIDMTPRTHD